MRETLQIDIGNGLDMIGDIHGCYDEFIQLLHLLGYVEQNGLYRHPAGRKLVSVGDITSRGPKSIPTLQFFITHVNAGLAYMTDSNHGWKIARWLDGRNVQLTHGDDTVANEFEQFEQQYGSKKTLTLKEAGKQLLLHAPSHYILMADKKEVAVVTHAGIRDAYIGHENNKIKAFTRYGDVRGFDETGRPIRFDWFTEHRSPHTIIWGHDPKLAPLFTHNTINIDQGCVFGGALTGLRFPELTIESVKGHNYSNDLNNVIIQQQQQQQQ